MEHRPITRQGARVLAALQRRGRVNLLVIGGGGVFGRLPAELLARVNPGTAMFDVDMVAGASIGGVLSMMVASGRPCRELPSLFEKHQESIFRGRTWPMGRWWGARHPSDGLEAALAAELPMRMGDLELACVVPSLSVADGRPKVFDNVVGDDDMDELCADVGRATCAAPTYFDPVRDSILVDGGLVDNLPVMQAVAALHGKLGVPPSKVRVLALGCGRKPRRAPLLEGVRKWTRLDWAKWLLGRATEANEAQTAYVAANLGLERFRLVDPFEVDGSFDDPKAVDMRVMGGAVDAHAGWFADAWRAFVD